jgi:hypothetical protein
MNDPVALADRNGAHRKRRLESTLENALAFVDELNAALDDAIAQQKISIELWEQVHETVLRSLESMREVARQWVEERGDDGAA